MGVGSSVSVGTYGLPSAPPDFHGPQWPHPVVPPVPLPKLGQYPIASWSEPPPPAPGAPANQRVSKSSNSCSDEGIWGEIIVPLFTVGGAVGAAIGADALDLEALKGMTPLLAIGGGAFGNRYAEALLHLDDTKALDQAAGVAGAVAGSMAVLIVDDLGGFKSGMVKPLMVAGGVGGYLLLQKPLALILQPSHAIGASLLGIIDAINGWTNWLICSIFTGLGNAFKVCDGEYPTYIDKWSIATYMARYYSGETDESRIEDFADNLYSAMAYPYDNYVQQYLGSGPNVVGESAIGTTMARTIACLGGQEMYKFNHSNKPLTPMEQIELDEHGAEALCEMYPKVCTDGYYGMGANLWTRLYNYASLQLPSKHQKTHVTHGKSPHITHHGSHTQYTPCTSWTTKNGQTTCSPTGCWPCPP